MTARSPGIIRRVGQSTVVPIVTAFGEQGFAHSMTEATYDDTGQRVTFTEQFMP